MQSWANAGAAAPTTNDAASAAPAMSFLLFPISVRSLLGAVRPPPQNAVSARGARGTRVLLGVPGGWYHLHDRLARLRPPAHRRRCGGPQASVANLRSPWR